jgi:hypothetical protein
LGFFDRRTKDTASGTQAEILHPLTPTMPENMQKLITRARNLAMQIMLRDRAGDRPTEVVGRGWTRFDENKVRLSTPFSFLGF